MSNLDWRSDFEIDPDVHYKGDVRRAFRDLAVHLDNTLPASQLKDYVLVQLGEVRHKAVEANFRE